MVRRIYEKINSNKIFFVLFFIMLTLLSSVNIFHSGLIAGDDINFHIHRIMAIVDNIRIGSRYVPVYFNYLKGFGYGNGLFYPDLFLFIPALFNYLGIDIILSLKIFILIINAFSIYTMYLCVYRITKEKKCAYASMFLYALCNYRLIDFVSRGSLGEMISFVFFPLIILGLYEIFFGESRKGYFLTIGLSGLCFSHVISFYLFCFFIFLFIVFNIKLLSDKSRLKFLFFYIFLAMIITMHVWLPMLEQLFFDSFRIDAHRKIFENIIPIYFLFLDVPYNIITNYYIAGVGLIYYISIFKYHKSIKTDRFLLSIVILGVVATVFVSIKLVWRIDIFYKLFSVIQFPWRFYIISSVFFIIGFSILLKYIRFNKFLKFCFVYIGLIFIFNSALFFFDFYMKEPFKDEIMVGEYLPKCFDVSIINNYKNKNISYNRNNNVLTVDIMKNVDSVELPLIYYKGYVACGDECYDVFKTSNGLVGIKNVKDGVNFNVWYKGTNIYNMTKYISFLGFLILIYKIKKCS